MAVNVRIPGIGNVVADNAATENTLRQLVTSLGQQQSRARRSDSEIAAASRQQAGFADRAADSMGQMASSAKSSESAARSLFSNLSEQVTRATNVVGSATQDISSSGVTTYLKQLGATAVEVSTMWAKNYGDIRDNPIKQAKNILSTGIDATVTGMGSVLAASAKKLGLPDEAVGALTAVVKGGLQTANQLLYDEVNQTIKSYSAFNKMGVSFGGAMSEMRTSAGQAGLLVDQFSSAMAKAEPNLKQMGLTTAEAINKVSAVGFEFGKVRADGSSLRKELMGMGYSVEEQVELAAQYMANIRQSMTAEKFAAMNEKTVAQQTRQYAEDLKVLTDITGKNAKQAMEEARAKSMEADIMARLGSPEEIKKFQAAYANMPDYAKKGFLEYVSSGGQAIVDQATNIAMAQNAEIKPMYEQAYANIYDVGKNATHVQTELLNQASRAGEEQRRVTKEAGGGIITMAARFGASGLDQLAGFFNSMVSTGLYTPEAVEKSRKAAQANANLTEDLTKNLTEFRDKMNTYATTMQAALDPALKVYTDALNSVAEKMNKFVLINVYGAGGVSPGKDKEGNFLPGPGNKADKPYSGKEYRNDLETLLLEVLQSLITKIPKMAKGGTVTTPTLAVVGEGGPEAIIPLASGNVPVQISGPANNLAELSGAMQQMQSSFSSLLANAKNTQPQKEPLMREQVQELPTALSTALETVLSSPTGLVQTMTQVKTQIADDNKMQMSMMQEQIENLTKLVDAMNENVRYSERLANELA